MLTTIIALVFYLLTTPLPQQSETIYNPNSVVYEIITSEYSHLDRDTAKLYASMIEKEGKKYGIDPVLITAIIAVESNFNSKAVSNKNAIGLMQILPSTGKMYGVTESELRNGVKNIEVGVKYLAELKERFGSINHAIIAYNQGPSRVNRGNYSTWYLKKVMKKYKEFKTKIKTDVN